MVMLRPSGKAYKVAKEVMKQKGVKVRPPKAMDKVPLKGPFLQH